MYPMGPNGATQAIVEASVLAESLARLGRAEDGLLAYEAERRPVTTELQERNRGIGAGVGDHYRAPASTAGLS